MKPCTKKLIFIGWSVLFLFCFSFAHIPAQAGQNTQPQIKRPRPKIGLALSGGGARGFAHIGVLKVLEELRIPVDFIAGTSMGSVIGGLYSIGYSPQELAELVTTIDWQDLFRDTQDRSTLLFTRKRQSSKSLLEIRLRGLVPEIPSGLSSGEKVSNLFSLLTAPAGEVRNFDRLQPAFRAIATDIVTGKEVILDGSQLSLADSMRASMAVPLIFTPLDAGEHLLVDGGLVKNLPVDVVRQMGADIVIAVNVSTRLRTKDDLRTLFAIMDQTISLQIVQSTASQLAMADLVVMSELDTFSSVDFARASELVAKGEEMMRTRVGELHRLISAFPPFRPLTESVPPPRVSKQRDMELQETLQINKVMIQGNVSTRELGLLRQLGIAPGQTLQAKELEGRIREVFGEAFLDSVYLGIEQEKEGGETLTIRVKENDLNTFHLGVFSNNKYRGVGFTSLTLRPWQDYNALLSTEVQFGSVLALEASYLQYSLLSGDFFFRPRVFYRDDFQRAFIDQDRVGDYRYRTRGIELAFGNSFRNLGEVTAGYQWQWTSFQPDAGGRNLPRFRGTLGRLSLSSEIDTLDEYPFPDTGRRFRFSSEIADEVLGGEESFARLSLLYQHFVSPWRNHTFSITVQLASSLGSTLPVSEELLFGGVDSFYGYAWDELRGSELGVLRFDYRYRLLDLPAALGRGVYLNLGLNAGNIWRSFDDLEDDFHLRFGGRIGLALDTVVGPAALDYGSGGDGRNKIYFSVGVPF